MAERQRIQELEAFIQNSYLVRLKAYLRGEEAILKDPKIFMKVNNGIQAELDEYDNSKQMYDMYIRLLNDYFVTEVQPRMSDKNGEEFLLELAKQWESYTIFATLLNRLFDYLNRNYLNSLQHKPKLGLQCQIDFKARVISGLEDELTAAISDQLTRVRNDEQINRDALKTAIKVYVDLGKEGNPLPARLNGAFFWKGTSNLSYYEENFESKFLILSKSFFHARANQWNSECNCESYLNEVNKAITNEETNADFWLEAQTKPKVISICVNELITNMADKVVDKEMGVAYFFKQK